MNRERLVELQKIADEAKYYKGFEEQYDPSGDMPFCTECPYQSNGLCILPYSSRLEQLTCGKAYAKHVDAMLAESTQENEEPVKSSSKKRKKK